MLTFLYKMCKSLGMNNLISRSEARSQGLSKYFTGKPCSNGHVSERYVQSGTCQDCIKVSRAMIIAPKQGEILSPDSIEKYQDRQIIIQDQRSKLLELKEREITIQEQKIILRTQQAIINQNRIIDRAERNERRERRDTVKSKLVEVILFVHELDHSSVSLMNWGFAAMRDPRLKLEDLAVRQMPDSRFVFRCFPEDKAEIMRAAQNLWDLRQGDFKSEIEERRLAVVRTLELEAEDNGEPEGDPR